MPPGLHRFPNQPDMSLDGVTKRLLRNLLALLLLATGQLLSVPGADAQTSSSIDPLEILRNLSPEERSEISRQVGGGGSQSSSNRDRTDSRDQSRDEQRDPRSRIPSDDKLRNPNALQGGDFVIVEIDFHRIRPVTAAAPTNSLQSATPSADSATNEQIDAAAAAAGSLRAMPSVQVPQTLRSQEVEAPLSAGDKERLQKLMDLIRAKNPYQLSLEGMLQLPGFAAIPLGGLTQEQATVRLAAEPSLRPFDFVVTRLPLNKLGTDALKPFGYDLFQGSPSTFAPVTNVPVPADYVMGAGDHLDVQLYGNQNRSLQLIVGRDGRINFPEIGPINVAGQSFNAVKSSIEARVERQMTGVHASVSMGDTRSIRVLVMGEVQQPGSYIISGLGTITSALYAAGGVKPIGSLRHIALKRDRKSVV